MAARRFIGNDSLQDHLFRRGGTCLALYRRTRPLIDMSALSAAWTCVSERTLRPERMAAQR